MADIITILSGLLSIVASIISIVAITKANSIKKDYQKLVAKGDTIYQAGGNIYEKDSRKEKH